MKKILLCNLLVVLYLTSTGQPRFGIVGGAVLTKTNEGLSSDNRLGVYLGTIMDLKLGKSISFRPQLEYIMKGNRTVVGEKGSYHYLELPINFVYNVPTKAGRFSFGCGPVLSYMIDGSWTSNGGRKKRSSLSMTMLINWI